MKKFDCSDKNLTDEISISNLACALHVWLLQAVGSLLCYQFHAWNSSNAALGDKILCKYGAHESDSRER